MVIFKPQTESLMPNDLTFFEKAGTHNDVMVASQLIAAGVEFKFQFFNVSSSYKGEPLVTSDVPVSMYKTLQGQLTAEQKVATAKVVAVFLKNTREAVMKIAPNVLVIPKKKPAAAPPVTVTTKSNLIFSEMSSTDFITGLTKASDAAKEAAAGFAVAAEIMDPSKDKPIKLSKAEVLGQAVYGSDPGNIYRLVAKGPDGARLAVRFEPNKAHFRVESMLMTPKVQARLKECGFSKKSHVSSKYWSSHMVIGGIPRMRVLGAVLFDLADHFPEHVQSLKEVGCD